MADCAFCGKALPASPQTFVERPDHEGMRTELSPACPECAPGFPTKFTVG